MDIGSVSGGNKYGAWVVAGLAAFALLTFFASRALVPASPFHYQSVVFNEKDLHLGFAYEGQIPHTFVGKMTLSNPSEFKQHWLTFFDYFDDNSAINGAYKIVLTRELPASSYVMELRCAQDQLVLPLFQLGPETYVSKPFVPLNANDKAKYTQSVSSLECLPGHDIVFTLKKIVFDP